MLYEGDAICAGSLAENEPEYDRSVGSGTMAKKTRPAKATKARKSTAEMRGKIVEQIVADLHTGDGVTVRTNVRLPTRSGTRRREIDVLIEGHLAGYPVRIAIECKNYREVIDVKKIDEFFGMLDDIGIPPSLGILVSARGFTQGAAERASKVGIQLFVLSGLSDDRLSSLVYEASQSVVYLFAQVKRFDITTDVAKTDNSFQLFTYRDKDGKLQALLPDVVWSSWQLGHIPLSPGIYSFEVVLPDDWKVVVDEHQCEIYSARVELQVSAIVYTFGGEMTQHSLSDPLTGRDRKWKTKVTFDPALTKPQVVEYFDAQALETYLQGSTKPFTLTQRILLPRIRFNNMLWPPSDRTYEWLKTDFQKWTAAGRPIPRQMPSFEELEGHFLQSITEPIFSRHQSARLGDWTEMMAASTKLKRTETSPPKTA